MEYASKAFDPFSPDVPYKPQTLRKVLGKAESDIGVIPSLYVKSIGFT